MSQEPDIRVTENKMGTQPVGRLLAGMAIPMMISMLVQALYNIVDSVFVSRLSENALTAVSLAFPLQNLMIAVCAGTTVGMNALLSRSLGAKEQDRADRAANTGIFLALASFVVFALIGAIFSRTFFLLQTDVAEIVDYGTDYARVCLCCSIGLFCQFTFERLLQSTGRTHLSMCTQILGAVINIALDPILIFGLLGAPKLGVLGAAVATVIGQWFGCCVCFILNLRFNNEVRLHWKKLRFDGPTVAGIYDVGLPSIIMQSISSVMNFGMNKILIGFSETAVSVLGVYFKLQSFVFMPGFGLTNALVPIVGYNYGARRKERILSAIKVCMVAMFCVMALGTVIFQLFPGQLLAMFSDGGDLGHIGQPALRIISLSFLFAGVDIVFSSLFQAVGEGLLSLLMSAFRQLVLLLPVAWLLSLTGNLDAVWYSFFIAEVCALVLATLFFRRTYKNKIQRLETIEFK